MIKLLAYGLALIWLNVIDCLCTSIILNNGGVEIMPIARYIIDNYGLHALMMFKLVVSLLVIAGSIYINSVRYLQLAVSAMLIVCVIVGIGAIVSFM